MPKEDQSSPKHSDTTCSDEMVAPYSSDIDTATDEDNEKEQFEWMTEPDSDSQSGATAEVESTETETERKQPPIKTDVTTVPWQTYCSMPTWGIHRVKVQCDTYSPHSTLYGTFRQTVAGKIAMDLGQQTIDLPAMELEGDTVVSIEVNVEGQLFQIAARLTATSGPISLRLGRDVLAGRFLVDAAKRSDGNA